MYMGCGLIKGGKRYGIIEGLRHLHPYCTKVETAYEAALSNPFNMWECLTLSWTTSQLWQAGAMESPQTTNWYDSSSAERQSNSRTEQQFHERRTSTRYSKTIT